MSRFPSLNSQEDELVENLIGQELHCLAINKSDNRLQKLAKMPKYPTLKTLNEIIIDDERQNDNEVP